MSRIQTQLLEHHFVGLSKPTRTRNGAGRSKCLLTWTYVSQRVWVKCWVLKVIIAVHRQWGFWGEIISEGITEYGVCSLLMWKAIARAVKFSEVYFGTLSHTYTHTKPWMKFLLFPFLKKRSEEKYKADWDHTASLFLEGVLNGSGGPVNTGPRITHVILSVSFSTELQWDCGGVTAALHPRGLLLLPGTS